MKNKDYKTPESDFGQKIWPTKILKKMSLYFKYGAYFSNLSWSKAVEANDLKKIQDLYEYGIAPENNEDNRYFYQQIILKNIAKNNSDPLILKYILKLGIDPNIKDTNNLCDAAIHRTVRSLKTEHLKILLEFGADPNIRDGNKFTPALAVLDDFQNDRLRNKEVCWALVQMLIDKGANPNHPGNYGAYLTSYADSLKRLEWLSTLKCNTDPNFLIENWLMNGMKVLDDEHKWMMVKDLILKGGDVNQVDDTGKNIFQKWMIKQMAAGNSGFLWEEGQAYYKEMTQFIENGANLSHQDKNGNNMIHLIVKKILENDDFHISGYIKAITALNQLIGGILFLQKNKIGETPIDLISRASTRFWEENVELKSVFEKYKLQSSIPENKSLNKTKKLRL